MIIALFIANFIIYDDAIFGFRDNQLSDWLVQNEESYLTDAADTRGCEYYILSICVPIYTLQEIGSERACQGQGTFYEIKIPLTICSGSGDQQPNGPHEPGGQTGGVPGIGGGGSSSNNGDDNTAPDPGANPPFDPGTWGNEGNNDNPPNNNQDLLERLCVINAATNFINSNNLPISANQLNGFLEGNCPCQEQDSFNDCVVEALEENAAFPFSGWLDCSSFDLQPILGGSALAVGIDDLTFVFDLPDGTPYMSYLFDVDVRIPTQAQNGELLDADGIKDCLSRAFNYAGRTTGIIVAGQLNMGGTPSQQEILNIFLFNVNNAFNEGVLPTWWGTLPCSQINNSPGSGFMIKHGSLLNNRKQAIYTDFLDYVLSCW